MPNTPDVIPHLSPAGPDASFWHTGALHAPPLCPMALSSLLMSSHTPSHLGESSLVPTQSLTLCLLPRLAPSAPQAPIPASV